MASYRASTTGNWSNLAIWQIWNGSAWVSASVLPGAADDVWANNFTVTIDQDITVLSLRNAANTTPSITVGGQFQINSGNITVNITTTPLVSYFRQLFTGNTPLLLHQNSTGTTTIYCNWNVTQNPGDIMFFRATGSGTINWIGTIIGTVSGQDLAPIRLNSALTFNFIGDLIQQRTLAWNPGASCITTGINGVTINVTGNLSCASSSPNSSSCINTQGFSFTINVTGNVLNNSADTGITINCIQGTGAGVVVVNGNVKGGTIPNANLAINNTQVNTTVIVNGTVIGGAGVSVGGGCSAIDLRNVGTTCFLSGPFIIGNYGAFPFLCSRVILTNNTSNYIDFASNSGGGNTFPSTPPTRFVMYSPNTIADSPIPANVRQGTVYALGSQTGTLIVPSPSNVRKDIPTDNTVGTADLTAQDFIDLLSTSSDAIAVRLRNVATVETTGNQIADLS